jgi:hypothetical protein
MYRRRCGDDQRTGCADSAIANICSAVRLPKIVLLTQ